MTVSELCAALIRIPTTEPATTAPAITLCAEVLAPAGFRLIHQFETAPGIASALLERAGDGPPLLIDGHLDTVPVGQADAWQCSPLGGVIAEGAVWGRGAVDDKGPLAAAVAALRGYSGSRRLLLSLTGDEELYMRGIQRMLEHPIAGAATQAIALEPTELIPVHAHKGNANVRVEVTGQAAHASRPWAGRNAIDEKMWLIAAMQAWFAAGEATHRVAAFEDEAPTLVVTREFTPNEAYNVIPAHACYWYNYRPLPGEHEPFDRLLAQLRDLAAAWELPIVTEIEFLVPAFLTPTDTPLIRALARASGQPAGWVAYGTHAGYLADGTREVAVFGPGSITRAHRENEHITLLELAEGVEMLQGLLALLA